MSAAADRRALDSYFAEASAWDLDRVAQYQASTRRAWQVAIMVGIYALVVSCALLFLMPFRHVEPFIVRVDNSTGIVDVVPTYVGAANWNESVSRYFLVHYVQTCERFNYATAESDYEECGAFHTARRNQLWSALWARTNASSPLNLHKDGSAVAAQVESVSFFKRANDVADLAQVRYRKTQTAAGGSAPQVTHWIATIQYSYSAPSTDPAVRRWNPIGFKVLDFVSEPEVLRESSGEYSTTPVRALP